MARVDGKVVLISGGARGMGAAHAEALVSEGARVVIGDILDDAGGEVSEKLGEAGHFVHLDVTDADHWGAAVDTTLTRFARLDALVNNAGIVKVGPLRGSSVADWQHVIDVNLTGAYLGMRAVVEPMITGGGGSIVNISSAEGLAGSAHLHAYVAAKFGLPRHHQVDRRRARTARHPRELDPPWPCAHADEQRGHRALHGTHPDAPRGVARRNLLPSSCSWSATSRRMPPERSSSSTVA